MYNRTLSEGRSVVAFVILDRGRMRRDMNYGYGAVMV